MISTSALPAPVPNRDYGGLENIAYDSAAAMAQMGNEVSLITTDQSQELGFHSAVDEKGEQKGYLNVISAGPTAWDTFGERNMFFRYKDWILGEFGNGQGVIIDHSWFGYVYFLQTGAEIENPRLTIKSNRALKICHVFHGVTGWREQNGQYVRPAVDFPRFIGVSKSHAQYISNCFGVPAKHVFNGIHLPEHPECVKGDYLLSLNRISEEKGIHNSIDVAISTGNKIKVVGDDTKVQNPQYVWQIMNQCAETGAEYIGPVSNDEKWELIKNCKALITCPNLENYKESFYLGAVEGFSMGKPIFALPNGGLQDYVINGVNGYLCPNPESMKEILAQNYDFDPAKIRAEAEKFTVERMANSYLELCRKILNNEPDGLW